MPHVTIKHFPTEVSEQQKSILVEEINDAIQKAFGVTKNVISIALESVKPEDWNEQVYIPEIEQKKKLLLQAPNYK